MSDTKVDMPKVCQMLDAGWYVQIHKDGMGSYTAEARHPNKEVQYQTETTLHDLVMKENPELGYEAACLFAHTEAADFTPEQALTRLAYKVHGEII